MEPNNCCRVSGLTGLSRWFHRVPSFLCISGFRTSARSSRVQVSRWPRACPLAVHRSGRPLLHILREEGEHLLRISSEVVVELVNRMACPSCEVTVLDMQDTRIANRAKELGTAPFRLW